MIFNFDECKVVFDDTKPLGVADIHDGNGKAIAHVLWIDIVTGEYERLKEDEHGKFTMGEDGRAKRERGHIEKGSITFPVG